MGPFVVDFVCLAENLVVELDGPQHLEGDAPRYDAERTAWLAARGYRVIRFWNREVDENVCGVVERVRAALLG